MPAPPTREELHKLIFAVFVLCIIIFVYNYYKINKLESEIDTLDHDNIYNDKALYEYIKTNDKEIKDISVHLKDTDLNIDRLHTVINSYVSTSIKKSNTADLSINPTSINDINNSLQSYISLNDEKLDAYILETNTKLTELTETNTTIMDSINNINTRLT